MIDFLPRPDEDDINFGLIRAATVLGIICLNSWSFKLGPLWVVIWVWISIVFSWRFLRYSGSIHWLVHGHMTSNNETVSQMPWAGNIAKTMTSKGKKLMLSLESQRVFQNLLLFCLETNMTFVLTINGIINYAFAFRVKCIQMECKNELNIMFCPT